MKKKPQRMCVSCREKKDKNELARIVLLEDGSIVSDPTGKMPGRGSYICRNEKCIKEEIKAHRLSKGLRHSLSADEIENVVKSILDAALEGDAN